MQKMTLGNRMKSYESCYRNHLIPRSSVIVRIDGKAFHTFTKRAEKPFDGTIITGMVNAAEYLFKNMQGCKLAYIQSDEASFWLTDFDNLETDGWFNYNHSKIVSVSASIFTAAFNYNSLIKAWMEERGMAKVENLPVFDSRAFNIPNEEIANYFLWRAKDWERNSLQMYCRSFFSHKQLENKNKNEMHEMLYGIDKNWTNDLMAIEKNGTFLWKKDRVIEQLHYVQPHFQDIDELVQAAMPRPKHEE